MSRYCALVVDATSRWRRRGGGGGAAAARPIKIVSLFERRLSLGLLPPPFGGLRIVWADLFEYEARERST